MIQVAVGILINDGKVLLCQRKPTARYPFKWEFPGGKMEDDETVEDCLRRELFEELGITAEIGELFHRQHAVYPDSGSFDVCYYFIPSFVGVIVNKVFSTVEWVPLPKLFLFDILEGNREVIQKLLSTNGKEKPNTR